MDISGYISQKHKDNTSWRTKTIVSNVAVDGSDYQIDNQYVTTNESIMKPNPLCSLLFMSNHKTLYALLNVCKQCRLTYCSERYIMHKNGAIVFIVDTVKPVYNDHLYDKIYYLSFIK